jgi:hypothetical protein
VKQSFMCENIHVKKEREEKKKTKKKERGIKDK